MWIRDYARHSPPLPKYAHAHVQFNASHWQNIMVTDLEGEIGTDVRTIDTVPYDNAFLTEQSKDVPTLEGIGRDNEEKSLNDVEDTSSDQQNISLPPLSIEAKNLLKYMETNTIKSTKKSEIMSLMEYTESVTRRLIQELIEHKFFIKNGEGKGTYYTFSPKP